MTQRGALLPPPSLSLWLNLSLTHSHSLTHTLSLSQTISLSPSDKIQEKIDKTLIDKKFGWDNMVAKSDLPLEKVSSILNPLACLPGVPNGTLGKLRPVGFAKPPPARCARISRHTNWPQDTETACSASSVCLCIAEGECVLQQQRLALALNVCLVNTSERAALAREVASHFPLLPQIPVVCVCLQGGPGSIQTVYDAVKHGTPALLVRGSGKAADLIADATLLQFSKVREREIIVDARFF